MEEKVHSHIQTTVSRKKGGEILFPADFRGKGTQAAIKQAMSRLARAGHVKRLAHGIYYIPKIDPVLGELRPDVDEVVKMLAQKERIRVRPAGAYALHQLGLTTQVPMKRVYITDGNPRQFRLGKMLVRFKATSAKKLSTTGKISSLVIQAIEEIGVDQISSDLEKKILESLRKEDSRKLRHDLMLASTKVNDYIVRLMKKKEEQ
jgi:predicted transcriptional regulator of viral defense system